MSWELYTYLLMFLYLGPCQGIFYPRTKRTGQPVPISHHLPLPPPQYTRIFVDLLDRFHTKASRTFCPKASSKMRLRSLAPQPIQHLLYLQAFHQALFLFFTPLADWLLSVTQTNNWKVNQYWEIDMFPVIQNPNWKILGSTIWLRRWGWG